jgi:rhodanese-related sulfurtransferase
MRPEVTSPNAGDTLVSRRNLLALTSAAALGLFLPGYARAQAVEFTTMTADDAYAKAASGEIILVDIRTPQEWAQTGIGEGAIALDMTQQETFVGGLVALRMANPDTPIALICRTGNRSNYVAEVLAGQGFTGLVDIAEGMAGGPRGQGWIPRGLPIYAGTPELINERLAAVMP